MQEEYKVTLPIWKAGDKTLVISVPKNIKELMKITDNDCEDNYMMVEVTFKFKGKIPKKDKKMKTEAQRMNIDFS